MLVSWSVFCLSSSSLSANQFWIASHLFDKLLCSLLLFIQVIKWISFEVSLFAFHLNDYFLLFFCNFFPSEISLLFWLQAYAGSQVLQSIILLCTGTNKGGGYLAPRGVFLAMYVGLTIIWAILNTFALEVIAFIDIISIWWQVISDYTKTMCFIFFHLTIAEVLSRLVLI